MNRGIICIHDLSVFFFCLGLFGNERLLYWATVISIYFGRFRLRHILELIVFDILEVRGTYSAVHSNMRGKPELFRLFRIRLCINNKNSEHFSKYTDSDYDYELYY